MKYQCFTPLWLQKYFGSSTYNVVGRWPDWAFEICSFEDRFEAMSF